MSASPTPTDNRFSTITENDHGGIIWISSLMLCLYSALTLGVRCFIKRQYFGLDDLTFTAATIVAMGQFASIFVAAANGLGKALHLLSADDIRDAGEATKSSQIIFILALSLTKCSITLLIRRLFAQDMAGNLLACDAATSIAVAWGVASTMAVGIGCSPQQIIGVAPNCPNQALRWRIVGAFDVITEVFIILLSITLVWKLQMAMHLKVRVVFAFLFRIPVIIFAILHLYYAASFLTSSNPGVSITTPILYQQIELGYSLISATIPNLKSFLASFNSALGLDISHQIKPYASNTYSGSYRMQSLGKRGSQGSTSGQPLTPGGPSRGELTAADLRPDPVQSSATVAHRGQDRNESQEDVSIASADSQEMIIRRDFYWNVHFDAE